MRQLNEATNGHPVPVTRAWDARLAKIEERIAKSEQSHEERILILRDAMSDFVADFITNKVAPLHDEIKALKQSNAELKRQLQAKTDVDKQIEDVMKRLDARQLARDEAKRGKMGPQGQRGARGERGPAGARGPAGKPAKPAASFHSWHVDTDKFKVTVFFSDGTSLPPLDLMPLFKTYDEMTR
jgi:hypothetical protein